MVLCGPQPPSLIDARGKVTPQFISAYADPPPRASYGSTAPQNGYPTQSGAPPSLAQLQRHMMGPVDREIQIGDPESDISPEKEGSVNSVKKSVSNNTLSSRNLELHDSEVTPEPGAGLDLDQTTMIGSALDLDSLEGDRHSEQGHSQNSNSQNGSQIGLLKLSAV